jgi:hypothetical protein
VKISFAQKIPLPRLLLPLAETDWPLALRRELQSLRTKRLAQRVTSGTLRSKAQLPTPKINI